MQHTQKMIGKASANPKFEELDEVSAFCANGIMARQQGMRQMATGTPIAMVNDIGACQLSSTVALLVALKIDAAAIVAASRRATPSNKTSSICCLRPIPPSRLTTW